MTKKVLVTGAAGFIGSQLLEHLRLLGHQVAGCDVLSLEGTGPSPADPLLTRLRKARLAEFSTRSGIPYFQIDIGAEDAFSQVLSQWQPDTVVHLAAQAGVRHSMQAPLDFVTPNLVGFARVLDACHRHQTPRLLYASSSSVYGLRSQVPFMEADRTDQPQSFYAATKQANEAMAYAYHAQYGMGSIGMRFFTVYGPWGRTDMAPFMFAQSMRRHQPIKLFGEGKLLRDFTYVADIVEAIGKLVSPVDKLTAPDIVNMGHQRPVEVNSFVQLLAKHLKVEPIIEYAPMQAADVALTCASEERLLRMIGDWRETTLDQGLGHFVQWLESWDPLDS
jgi:UDP-glucuronate 4-epimerase